LCHNLTSRTQKAPSIPFLTPGASAVNRPKFCNDTEDVLVLLVEAKKNEEERNMGNTVNWMTGAALEPDACISLILTEASAVVH